MPPQRWACLDGSDPAQPTGDLIEFRFEVRRITDGMLLSDARVRACGTLDLGCDNPIVDDVPVTSGVASLMLRDDFSGYFEVVGNDFDAVSGKTGTYVPALVFFSQREIVRSTDGRGIFLASLVDLQNLTGLVGSPYALDQLPNGVLIATALDCSGVTAAGIRFNLLNEALIAAPETVKFYNNASQVPVLSLSETSESGNFGLTKMNQGQAVLSAFINPLGRPLATETAVLIRNKWMTYVFVSP